MKVFNSPIKDTAYLLYRLASPIFDPVDFFMGIRGYISFVKELLEYQKKDTRANISFRNLYPMVKEKSPWTPFDAHYYFQGIWLLRELMNRRPDLHVDVASKYELSGYISLVTKAEFVDLRPIDTKLKNLSIVRGDILHLPYKDNSLQSVSSLHVIEHIGLGRYGDEINPLGTILACNELSRVVRPGGYVYVTVPIGRTRTCFNAHRVHMASTIVKYFHSLKLIRFSEVDDHGEFHATSNYRRTKSKHYGCGLFIFMKEKYDVLDIKK